MQPGESVTPEPTTNQKPEDGAQVPPKPPVETQEPGVSSFEESHPQPGFAPHVTWTASEYIAHAKGMGWFVLLGLGLFALIGLVYVITKDVVASVLVGMAGITFGIFAARPPRVLNYTIDSHGITIGERSYHFTEFKSFALTESGPFPSVLLMPLKRFLPPITVFYDPKEEDAIVDALAAYLPHEEKEPDMVDRLMSRIRF